MMLVIAYYIASGCMQNYQKNIKKALLTDNTIMLWNDGYVIFSCSCVSCATRLPCACLIARSAKQLCLLLQSFAGGQNTSWSKVTNSASSRAVQTHLEAWHACSQPTSSATPRKQGCLMGHGHAQGSCSVLQVLHSHLNQIRNE